MITIMDGDKLVEMVHEDDFQVRTSGGGIEMLIQPTTRRMILVNGIVGVEIDQAKAKGEGAAEYMSSQARFVNPNFDRTGLPVDAQKFFA